ncbi:MAG: VanZ family protein [Ruminococcaceae bacterium]|nr:VanZ family protein [Oscillospiraceae bacterium]
MNKKVVFRILTVLATAFIFSNSLKTAESSAQSSGNLVKIFDWFLGLFAYHPDINTLQNIVRKTAHFLEFSLQGFLLCGSFSGKFKEKTVYVLFFGLLTACVDEYLQLFFEGRGSQIQDVFIDFAGTAWGLVFCGAIDYLWRKKT